MKTYDDEELRFEHPGDWELEATDEEGVRTIAAHGPDGLAFIIITIDPTRPDPAEAANEALEAMREEYPELDSTPILESINDHAATGHDIEFMVLDATNSAMIRCFRTPSRTFLIFGQWSDLGPDDLGDAVRDIIGSIDENE